MSTPISALKPLHPHWVRFLVRHTLLGAAETIAAFAMMAIVVFWRSASTFTPTPRLALGEEDFYYEFFSCLWDHFGQRIPYEYFEGLIAVTVIVYAAYVAAQLLLTWIIIKQPIINNLPEEIIDRAANRHHTHDTDTLNGRKKACRTAVSAAVSLRRALPILGLACYFAWAAAAYFQVIENNTAFDSRPLDESIAPTYGPAPWAIVIGTALIGLWANLLYFIRLHEFDPVTLWTSGMSEEERSKWRGEISTDFRSRTAIDIIIASSPWLSRRSIYSICALATFSAIMLALAAVLPYWPGPWLASFVQVTVILSFVLVLVIDRFVGKINQAQTGTMDAEDVAIVLSFSRLPRRAATSEEWARVGITDALSGVSTRPRFEHELRDLINSGTSFALAHIDMDDFKSINTIFLHEGGDRAIRYVGSQLQTLMPDCRVGRLGGDEFAIAVPGDKAHAFERLRNWRDKTLERRATQPELNEIAPYIGLSIGVTYHSTEDTDGASPQTTLESLIRQADTLAFEAKGEGKNGIMASDVARLDTRSEKEKLESQSLRLLKMALQWPALQDVVSWEVVETRRVLQMPRIDDTALRTRRRHMILLDRRIMTIKSRLHDIVALCEQRRDSPHQPLESADQTENLKILTNMGFQLCKLVKSALTSGIRPSFREGAIRQLDIFIERLNHFHAAFTKAKSGVPISMNDLRHNVGIERSSPSESHSVMERIPGGYSDWSGIIQLIEREKTTHIHTPYDSSSEHHSLISHLDRKCVVLEELIKRTLNGVSGTDGAHAAREIDAEGFSRRANRAIQILNVVIQKMVDFEPQRTILDANAAVSEYIIHIGVLEDLVVNADYGEGDEKLREIGRRYGI